MTSFQRGWLERKSVKGMGAHTREVHPPQVTRGCHEMGGPRGTPLQLPPLTAPTATSHLWGVGPAGMRSHLPYRQVHDVCLPRVLYLLQALPIHIPKTLFNVSLPRLIGIINQLGSLINPF